MVAEWNLEMSQAEVDQLGLYDKIKHYRLLGHHARRRAGPMWKHGRPAGPEELSDHWREWSRRAENYEAEVKRLEAVRDRADPLWRTRGQAKREGTGAVQGVVDELTRKRS